MNIGNVVARFLPLLDVTLILLGLLMAALVITRPTIEPPPPPIDDGLKETLHFIYLYAGWFGQWKGKCYLIDTNAKKLGREISLENPQEFIDEINSRHWEPERTVIVLLFDKNGWFAPWEEKLGKLRQALKPHKITVIPVYNFDFEKQGIKVPKH